MRPVYITVELIVHAEPTDAMALLKDAICRGGAVITGATRFSNKALSLQLEVVAKQLGELRAALASVASVAAEGPPGMLALSEQLSPNTEVIALLHITLMHNAPDERVELPKVPG